MKNKAQNIITLIKEDHKPLKEGIRILTSDSSKPSEKKSALVKFLRDLKIHAKAEEMSLYHNEAGEKEVRDEVLEGYVEHAVAESLSRSLEKHNMLTELSDEVLAKAKVLAELVKHHVEEEEEELLPDVKKAEDEDRLIELGKLYLQAKSQLQAIHLGTETPEGSAELKPAGRGRKSQSTTTTQPGA